MPKLQHKAAVHFMEGEIHTSNGVYLFVGTILG